MEKITFLVAVMSYGDFEGTKHVHDQVFNAAECRQGIVRLENAYYNGLAIAHCIEFLPCEFEDSPNCYWDAQNAGNRSGLSFVDIDGKIHRVHIETPKK